MTYKHIACKNEQGAALVATLMFLVAMGILATTLIFTAQNETKSSAAYKYGEQSFFVANAGVQKTLGWFVNNYTPHLPASDYDLSYTDSPYPRLNSQDVRLGSSANYPGSSSVTTDFSAALQNKLLEAIKDSSANAGLYDIKATLLKYRPVNFINEDDFSSYPSAIERWRIEATGYWGTDKNNPLGRSEIVAIIENSGNAMFDRALWGIDSVDLGGTVLIDSYDPEKGVWNELTNAGNLGAIGSNGSVDASGNSKVHGDVACGPEGSITQGLRAEITGDKIKLPEPRTFKPIPDFTAGSDAVSVNSGRTGTLDPSISPFGHYGAVDVKGTLTLKPGTYYFDSLNVTSNGSLKVSDATTIYIKNSLNMEGQSVSNTSLDPTKLTMFYAGTDTAKFAGGSQAYVELYAPNATIELVGNDDFSGSFVGKNIKATGTAKVHFSEGCLKEHLLPQPFRLITWSRSKY